ncbi:type I iodothyronine deiodinase-like [Tigriopus californicus]|uniref:type I iodothyronine deiodinase-like n=1 Tax=Tigriopus californicus TaxID=6832 RepID=UPI0027DA4C43|nr:type I iodothyronine deiodinase-like [Tigriopus californicus]
MAKIRAFESLVKKYAHLADFVVVYIEETHPLELGHVKGNYEISSHENLEQRLAAAQILADEVSLQNCPIVADTMDDATNILYGAMPERLYIIRDHKIVYQGNRGPFLYDLKEMEQNLVRLLDQPEAVITNANDEDNGKEEQ